jgi:hypothetical protein
MSTRRTSNIDPAAQAFISQMTGFMNGPGGQIRMWCNQCGTLGADWNSSIVAPFTVELNDQGHAAPSFALEAQPVTTYTFDRGPIKGCVRRWRAPHGGRAHPRIPVRPELQERELHGPELRGRLAVTEGGLNVNEPFYGPTDTHVDVDRLLSGRCTKNVNWRIQLNLQSVGEKDHLVPAAVRARWQPGPRASRRAWVGLENSFDF